MNSITQLLDLEDSDIVISETRIEGVRKIITLETHPDTHFCPQCGFRMHSRGIKKRSISHPVLQDGFELYLVLKQRRWRCTNPDCGYETNEEFRFVDKNRRITNAADILIVLAFKDLSESAALYASILPGGSTGEKKIDKLIQDIGGANATTAYSFLLALLRTWKQGGFSSQDIAEILEAFRIYCLRRRLISLSKAENKNFPMLVNHIPELQTAQDKKQKMFEILSNQESNLRLPNDIEILRTLETMNFYNFRYCKFFLSLVEEQLTKSRPDSSDEHLQIEHIMPQKLNNEWELELGEDYEMVHQEYVHTIGNLTLIRHNQELGQKKFSDKKEIYINNAGLQIAKTRITDQKHWNKRAIKSRAGWMIKYILSDVLPIPDKMRKVNNFAAKDGKRLSFQDLQLIGLDISFIDDPSIRAHVIGDRDVEFEGKKWKLSPLTREIQTRRGKVTPSGAYQGAIYWEYDGIKLADIM